MQGLDAASVSPDSMLRASIPTPVTAPQMGTPPVTAPRTGTPRVTTSQVENPDLLSFAFPADTGVVAANGSTPVMGVGNLTGGDATLAPSTQHPHVSGQLPDSQ